MVTSVHRARTMIQQQCTIYIIGTIDILILQKKWHLKKIGNMVKRSFGCGGVG